MHERHKPTPQCSECGEREGFFLCTCGRLLCERCFHCTCDCDDSHIDLHDRCSIRIAELEAALDKYGGHIIGGLDGCRKMRRMLYGEFNDEEPCTCGLEQALAKK